MTDRLVDKVRGEMYLLEIFKLTKKSEYINNTKEIIEFIKDIYRNIEPSHFEGKIVIFFDFSTEIDFCPENKKDFYDKGILNNSYNNLIFQIYDNSEKLPSIWTNIEDKDIENLVQTPDNFIAYIFENKKEYFLVNSHIINILNKYSCPSIFALQYHDLNEALLDYKNERIRTVSCEHFKKCWAYDNRIYLNNQPEECMQVSLTEFLKNRIRGVNAVREYNLGASKPVDVRVFWREANRAALIEVKWLGQSLKKDNRSIGTSYSNSRANDGMSQIKEYIDLNSSDSPTVITKGYLVVIDGRRKNIKSSIKTSISRADGFHYQNEELNISDDKQYWTEFNNIEEPIRMFVEPICEIQNGYIY